MFVSQQRKVQNLEPSEISAIRNGDSNAFEKLFDLHYEPLCRYANSILRKPSEAEDAVQQVFVNFWDKREKTIVTGSVKAFLYKSVHNYSLNLIKHDKVVARYQEHSNFYETNYSLAVEEDTIGNELANEIEIALNQLPPQCKRIFKMNRYEEKKYKEIAQELNLSIKTVENQIGKALKLMRSALSDYLVNILILLFLNL